MKKRFRRPEVDDKKTENESGQLAGNKRAADTLKKQPSITFEEISEGTNEVLVLYKDQIYRLRETKNGKLILNK